MTTMEQPITGGVTSRSGAGTMVRVMTWPIIALLITGVWHFTVEAIWPDLKTFFVPAVLGPVLLAYGAWAGYGATGATGCSSRQSRPARSWRLALVLDVVGFGVLLDAASMPDRWPASSASRWSCSALSPVAATERAARGPPRSAVEGEIDRFSRGHRRAVAPTRSKVALSTCACSAASATSYSLSSKGSIAVAAAARMASRQPVAAPQLTRRDGKWQ